MKAKLFLMLIFAGSIILASCTKYPDETERLLEDLVVVTQYDTKSTDYSFSDYTTFSVTDKVYKVSDSDTVEMTGSDVAACLDQIAWNMKQRGYVEAVAPQLPDLGINAVYYENTNVYVYYPYYYWGYDYYGWGWYYPYYPVYYSSYTTGALNITMLDLINKAPNDQLYVRWNAYIRGLLTGYHTLSEVTGAIDQAFIQTPQIQK